MSNLHDKSHIQKRPQILNAELGLSIHICISPPSLLPPLLILTSSQKGYAYRITCWSVKCLHFSFLNVCLSSSLHPCYKFPRSNLIKGRSELMLFFFLLVVFDLFGVSLWHGRFGVQHNWANRLLTWGIGNWGIIIGWGGGGGGGIIIGGHGIKGEGTHCLYPPACGTGNTARDTGLEDTNLGMIRLYAGWSGYL